jgi:hypothetical protein
MPAPDTDGGTRRPRRKSDLPVKTCATCGRPMVWRRRWAKVWDEVRHCSAQCRRARARGADAGVDGTAGARRDADGR